MPKSLAGRKALSTYESGCDQPHSPVMSQGLHGYEHSLNRYGHASVVGR